MHPDLELAMVLADMADIESMRVFRSRELVAHSKPDMTPVTEADHNVENALRQHISETRPGHAVLGEEFGTTGSADSEWRWVIDPIDGTRSYIRGNETWATLIALQHHADTVIAVASMPALAHRYAAVRGEGATLNGHPIHVSAVSDLSDALLTHTSIPGFVRTHREQQLVRLGGLCWDARGLGNSMSHLAVARGTADIGWTSRANTWDFAALALIVTEAGGRFTDRSDDDPVLGGTGVSTNGLLHEEVLRIIGVPKQ